MGNLSASPLASGEEQLVTPEEDGLEKSSTRPSQLTVCSKTSPDEPVPAKPADVQQLDNSQKTPKNKTNKLLHTNPDQARQNKTEKTDKSETIGMLPANTSIQELQPLSAPQLSTKSQTTINIDHAHEANQSNSSSGTIELLPGTRPKESAATETHSGTNISRPAQKSQTPGANQDSQNEAPLKKPDIPTTKHKPSDQPTSKLHFQADYKTKNQHRNSTAFEVQPSSQHGTAPGTTSLHDESKLSQLITESKHIPNSKQKPYQPILKSAPADLHDKTNSDTPASSPRTQNAGPAGPANYQTETTNIQSRNKHGQASGKPETRNLKNYSQLVRSDQAFDTIYPPENKSKQIDAKHKLQPIIEITQTNSEHAEELLNQESKSTNNTSAATLPTSASKQNLLIKNGGSKADQSVTNSHQTCLNHEPGRVQAGSKTSDQVKSKKSPASKSIQLTAHSTTNIDNLEKQMKPNKIQQELEPTVLTSNTDPVQDDPNINQTTKKPKRSHHLLQSNSVLPVAKTDGGHTSDGDNTSTSGHTTIEPEKTEHQSLTTLNKSSVKSSPQPSIQQHISEAIKIQSNYYTKPNTIAPVPPPSENGVSSFEPQLIGSSFDTEHERLHSSTSVSGLSSTQPEEARADDPSVPPSDHKNMKKPPKITITKSPRSNQSVFRTFWPLKPSQGKVQSTKASNLTISNSKVKYSPTVDVSIQKTPTKFPWVDMTMPSDGSVWNSVFQSGKQLERESIFERLHRGKPSKIIKYAGTLNTARIGAARATSDVSPNCETVDNCKQTDNKEGLIKSAVFSCRIQPAVPATQDKMAAVVINVESVQPEDETLTQQELQVKLPSAASEKGKTSENKKSQQVFERLYANKPKKSKTTVPKDTSGNNNEANKNTEKLAGASKMIPAIIQNPEIDIERGDKKQRQENLQQSTPHDGSNAGKVEGKENLKTSTEQTNIHKNKPQLENGKPKVLLEVANRFKSKEKHPVQLNTRSIFERLYKSSARKQSIPKVTLSPETTVRSKTDISNPTPSKVNQAKSTVTESRTNSTCTLSIADVVQASTGANRSKFGSKSSLGDYKTSSAIGLPLLMLSRAFGGEAAASEAGRRLTLGSLSRQRLDPKLLSGGTSMARSAIPVLPRSAAYTCLLLNIAVPGLGTAVSGLLVQCVGLTRYSTTTSRQQRCSSTFTNLVVALLQLYTLVFCLVGWFWSIGWGVIMVVNAEEHHRIQLIPEDERALSRRPSIQQMFDDDV